MNQTPSAPTRPLQPNTPLQATLSAEAWNVVLDVLGNGPFKMVAPIMGELQRQLFAAAEQQPQASPGPRANGDASIVNFPPMQQPQLPDGA
jgi:hypothetical protein